MAGDLPPVDGSLESLVDRQSIPSPAQDPPESTRLGVEWSVEPWLRHCALARGSVAAVSLESQPELGDSMVLRSQNDGEARATCLVPSVVE